MVMISDFYVAPLSRDLKVPGSSPGVGFFGYHFHPPWDGIILSKM